MSQSCNKQAEIQPINVKLTIWHDRKAFSFRLWPLTPYHLNDMTPLHSTRCKVLMLTHTVTTRCINATEISTWCCQTCIYNQLAHCTTTITTDIQVTAKNLETYNTHSGVAMIYCKEGQSWKLGHGALTADFRAGCSSQWGDTRPKIICLWLNLERTLYKRRGKMGVVRRRQL